MHGRSTHQDKIPAPTAETTRNESTCTAEARIRTKFPPRRPKRPETKAHALQKRASPQNYPHHRPKRPETKAHAGQKRASGQSARPDGPNDQKRKHMHCRSAHHHKIPAPTAQTIRNESAHTAEAHISTKFPPRRPKRLETKAHARQNCASAQNSRPDGPNDQKRKRMHGRSTHQDKIPAPTAQTTRNESARTAEAHISTKFPPRRPKRPETKAHARQKRASGQNCLH